MADHQDGVVQHLGSPLHIFIFDRMRGLHEIQNNLVVEQDHESVRGCSPYIVFAIRCAWTGHDIYLVDVPVFGVVFVDGGATLKLPFNAPMIAVTVYKSDG